MHRLKYIVFIDILYMSLNTKENAKEIGANKIGANKIGANKIGANKIDAKGIDTDDNMYTKINKLYSNSGYMSRYGSDVWAAAVMCGIVLMFTSYYIFVDAVEVLRSDWDNRRCDPLVLPFAGFIHKPTDQSNFAFTSTNFNDCVIGMLKEISEIAFQPLYFAVDVLNEAILHINKAFQKLRVLTYSLREQFDSITTQVVAGISNIVVFFIKFVVKMKDSMGKISGVLTTALYTLLGSYMAAESLFLSLIDLILIILIVIALAIVVAWVTAAALLPIPLFGPILATPWVIKAIIITLIMIGICIPIIYFETMMLKVMHLSTAPPPGIPGCFAGETVVELQLDKNSIKNSDSKIKTSKAIKDIQIGDTLKNGSIVTALLKFSAEEQHIYLLNNVLVTGEHRVLHPTLKWIKAKNHPGSIHMPDFNEPYVYCLGTTKKAFTIGETVFSDWDDIDDDVLEDLSDLCPLLPCDFKLKDIHTCLDSGFHALSTVVLADGSVVLLKDVKVGDKLLSEDKVVGTVKIATHDMDTYTYSFQKDGRTLCGTRNITLADNTLGAMNVVIRSPEEKEKEKEEKEEEKEEKEKEEEYMYHLLTDTSFFVVNTIKVHDYNFGIDKYLRNKLFTQ